MEPKAMNDSSPSRENPAAKLIAEKRYSDAITLLQERIADDPTSDDHSQLALAFLQLEDYESAAQQYETAARLDPTNIRLQEMSRLAKANAIGEVNVRVPEVLFFDRQI